MKKIILSILVIFLSLPLQSFALVLQGNAQYNAELAREETFSNINYALGPNAFRDYWRDPNFINNYNALNNNINNVENRVLALFSDGSYGVRYLEDPYHNYYYDKNGNLFKIDVLNKPFNDYPHKSVAYNRYGAFKNATFVISKEEQYLYDREKNLIGHWVGSACYDEKGNVLMLRKNAQ